MQLDKARHDEQHNKDLYTYSNFQSFSFRATIVALKLNDWKLH